MDRWMVGSFFIQSRLIIFIEFDIFCRIDVCGNDDFRNVNLLVKALIQNWGLRKVCQNAILHSASKFRIFIQGDSIFINRNLR